MSLRLRRVEAPGPQLEAAVEYERQYGQRAEAGHICYCGLVGAIRFDADRIGMDRPQNGCARRAVGRGVEANAGLSVDHGDLYDTAARGDSLSDIVDTQQSGDLR